MNLATWSIRNPIPVILLFTLLALCGLLGFLGLPIQDLPDLDRPTVTVTLAQPGSAPAQLETEVARKVEDSIATVTGVRHITTSISDGQVAVTVQFALETEISQALIGVKDAVDRVRSDLPADVLEPRVSPVQTSGGAILVYAVGSTRMDEERLSWFVDDRLAKAILAIPGVGRFERIGGVNREVRVEADPVRMAGLNVTAADVSRALRQVEQQSSGGRGQIGGQEQSVRTIATVRQAADLAALPIVLPGGRHLRLDQVATVSDTIAERTQLARRDGKLAVGFQIYRARGFDETRIAEKVRSALERLKAQDPSLSFDQVAGSVDFTLEQYHGSMDMLYEGACLTVLVVFLFLRDWRAALIASTALPLSILPAFAGMAALGYSLNVVTLLGLAIVVGVLVDDAIVEIENIERHARSGKPIREAAEAAVSEIGLAVIATTMSLVAVFLPTAMMSGVAGLVFKQFGWTVVIAVLSSLAVARLLTPMMAAYLLRPRSRDDGLKEDGDGWVMTRYLAAANWCLAHRAVTIGGAILVFAASLALAPLIPFGLLPATDRGDTSITFELPPGSSLDDTIDIAEAARLAINDVPGIRTILTTIGQPQQAGGGREQAGNIGKGMLILALRPSGERASQAEIEKQVSARLQAIPGARFSIGAGRPGEKMQLTLFGDNTQTLIATAEQLARELRDVPGLSNIQTTASLDRPEIVIRPDPARAAELGVSTQTIGDVARIATAGDRDQNVARLNLDNRQLYVRVQVPNIDRRDLDTFADLRVNARDGLVPLSSVADLSIESGPAQIDRYDRYRYVTVNADLGGVPLGTALAQTTALPALQHLSSGVQLKKTGDAEIQSELASSFGIAIAVGILCVSSVLILLFADVFQPITILSALPLSLGGAFLALLVTGSEFDIPSMLGLVMLMGIVAKNSILLVEFAILGIRDRGLSRHDALIDACHKRARPIVMTTVAMIAGMAPIMFGFSSGASFRQPMAIAVIGGLLSSTALSLLIVPVAFTCLDDLEKWIGRRLRPTDRSRPSAKETRNA
jgi:multidrug efflux pump subunit AcrB